MNMSSKIKPPNFFVIINNKINSSSRILLTGMLLSLLWFMIYYNAREYFFHPLYFVMPSLLIILILIVLPKLASKGSNNNANNILEGIDTSNMQIEQVQLSSQELSQSQEQPVTASNSNQVAIDESLIQQLIDEKINSIALEFNESKQKVNDALTTVNNIKTDIENLKKSIKELTEAFETTLVDFKAFQAEIANPLNFMRKYFDQLDIKNLSDPTLPLQQSDINTSNNNGNDEYSNGNSNGKALSKDNANDYMKNNHDDGKGNNSKNENKDSPIKDIITLAESNGITLSKLMELILTIGDFMRLFGNEYAKILDVQCKLLNLSREAEKIVYSIVDMLSKSTLTAEECVISLYKLASVLGFNDSNADTIYARVKMSIKSEHHNGRRLDDAGV
jgi:hypothetical protein